MDRLRCFLVALGLSPAAASALALLFPAPLTPAPAGNPRPPLAFHQHAVFLGEVPLAPVVAAHYEFVNSSDRPVTITKFKPSCGCLSTRLEDALQTEFRPGQFGRFWVTLPTANEEPGPHDYTIAVHYEHDGQPGEQQVRLGVVLPRQRLALEPREVYFYQTSGEPASQRVLVQDLEAESLEIVSAGLLIDGRPCDPGLATATIEPVLPAAGDEPRRLPVRIDVAGDVPRTRIIAHLFIETNDPEFRKLMVPVLIDGRRASVIPASGETPAGP